MMRMAPIPSIINNQFIIISPAAPPTTTTTIRSIIQQHEPSTTISQRRGHRKSRHHRFRPSFVALLLSVALLPVVVDSSNNNNNNIFRQNNGDGDGDGGGGIHGALTVLRDGEVATDRLKKKNKQGSGGNVIFPNDNPAVGEQICTFGYIMDEFCIKRGTLLDNPSFKTLENPEKHSVHCLVDVAPCLESPFHILQKDAPGVDTLYGAGWAVSNNDKLIEDARTVGSCSTCNTYERGSGAIEKGYQAEVIGKVVEVEPTPILEIVSVRHLQDGETGCNRSGGGSDGGDRPASPTSSVAPTMSSAPSRSPVPTVSLAPTTTGGNTDPTSSPSIATTSTTTTAPTLAPVPTSSMSPTSSNAPTSSSSPTLSPSPTTAGGGGSAPTISPSIAPTTTAPTTLAPVPTSSMSPTSSNAPTSSSSPTLSPSPTTTGGNPPSPAPPTISPSIATTTTAPTTFRMAATTPTMSVSPTSSINPSAAPSAAPTVSSNANNNGNNGGNGGGGGGGGGNGGSRRGIPFVIDFGFFPDTTLQEPTTEELDSLLANTERFYEDFLAKNYPDTFDSISLTISETTYDPSNSYSPVRVRYNADIKFTGPAGNRPSDEQVGDEMMNLDYQGYISGYVWGNTNSLFENTQMAGFNLLLGVTNAPTVSPAPTTPVVPTTSSLPTAGSDGGDGHESPTVRKISFTIDYGFFPEATLPEAIPEDEYNGLNSATNFFAIEVLKNAYPDTFVTFKLEMTGTDYDPQSNYLPVRVYFDAEVLFSSSDANPYAPFDEEVLDTLERGDYQRYIADFVWGEYPSGGTSIFKDTNAAAFNPAISNSGPGGTNSPTATPIARNVAFTIDYGFFPDATVQEPTEEELENLLANTERFYNDFLKEAYPNMFSGVSLTIAETSYDSANTEAPVRVYYDAEIFFSSPSNPPLIGELANAMENFNYVSYIQMYVWGPDTKSLFEDTNMAAFNPIITTTAPTSPMAPSPTADATAPTTSPSTNQITSSPTTKATAPTGSQSDTMAPTQTSSSTTNGMDAGDDDTFDNPCESQEQALEACASKNDCLKCEEEIAESADEGEFYFGGGGDGSQPPSPEDFAIMMEQIHAHLNGQCDFFKGAICQLKRCCPACSKEMDDAYACFSKSLADSVSGLADHIGGVLDDALGNLTDALGDILTNGNDGDALDDFALPPTLSPSASLPDFEFNCSFANLQCDATPTMEGNSVADSDNETKPAQDPTTGAKKVTVSGAFILEVKDPYFWNNPEIIASLEKSVEDFVQNLQISAAASQRELLQRGRKRLPPPQQQQPQQKRLLLRNMPGLQNRRQLASLSADSVQIYSLEPVECSATLQRQKQRKLRYLQANKTTPGNNNATTTGQADCAKVSISYDVDLDEGDNPQQVQQRYEGVTVDAIQSGSMQQSIDAVAGPNSSIQVLGPAEPAPLPETDAPALETPQPTTPPTANKDETRGVEGEDKADSSSTNVLAIVLGVVFGVIACILLILGIVFGSSIWLVCAAACCCCAAAKTATETGGEDNDKDKEDGGKEGECRGGNYDSSEEQAPNFNNTTSDHQAEEGGGGGDSIQIKGGTGYDGDEAEVGYAQETDEDGFESEDEFEESNANHMNSYQAADNEAEDEFEANDSSKFSVSDPEDPFDDQLDNKAAPVDEKTSAHLD